jgi:hypothetical protein
MSLDIHHHNKNLVSIKDLELDVEIADQRWDFIFNSLSDFEHFYFLGSRALDFDKKLGMYLNSYTNILLAKGSNYFEVFAKINLGNILINRNGINKLWEYYEYPSFIFCTTSTDKDLEILAINQRISYTEMADILEDILIIYREMEKNVLWMQKGKKAQFPIFPVA